MNSGGEKGVVLLWRRRLAVRIDRMRRRIATLTLCDRRQCPEGYRVGLRFRRSTALPEVRDMARDSASIVATPAAKSSTGILDSPSYLRPSRWCIKLMLNFVRELSEKHWYRPQIHVKSGLLAMKHRFISVLGTCFRL